MITTMSQYQAALDMCQFATVYGYSLADTVVAARAIGRPGVKLNAAAVMELSANTPFGPDEIFRVFGRIGDER
jgi:hypothetical protein